MKVKGREYRAVWMAGNSVVVIDQPLLPHRFALRRLRHHRETADAIRTMVIRGAGTIGATAGYGLAQAFAEAARLTRDPRVFARYVNRAYHTLNNTRPTAADLKHALDRVLAAALPRSGAALSFRACEGAESDETLRGNGQQSASSPLAPEARQRSLPSASLRAGYQLGMTETRHAVRAARAAAEAIANEYVERARAIAQHGLPLIRPGSRVLTHCNAGWLALVDWGSAPAPVYLAHRRGRKVFVWVDETRPRLQGANLTSWELTQEQVPHRIIADNAAGWLMRRGEVDLCIVGADRIAANGDAANKVGTYEKAVLAHANGIPFYVAAPSSTIDCHCPTGDAIPIEERDQDEVLVIHGRLPNGRPGSVRVAPTTAQAANPAFDVTPARYITGIITERGIIKPAALRRVFSSCE